jgi:hypothetical protein
MSDVVSDAFVHFAQSPPCFSAQGRYTRLQVSGSEKLLIDSARHDAKIIDFERTPGHG